MPITPDTKDWTWVLQRRCPECGFDAGAVELPQIPGLIADNTAGWAAVLARHDVRQRPDEDTWSPLEYAAHVRDVHLLFARRLHCMLTQDDPLFENWDQDATAVEQRYGEQDPAAVADGLRAAAASAAAAFAAVAPQQYGRTGRRSDGSGFTVLTLGRYFIHDPVHHLWDVTRP